MKNDFISRGDAEKARDELVRVLNYINSSGTLDYADYCELFYTIEREFNALKAVLQEMSVVEFVQAFQKMCEHIQCCPQCPLYGLVCGKFDSTTSDIDKAIVIVEKWTKEHNNE